MLQRLDFIFSATISIAAAIITSSKSLDLQISKVF